MSGMVFLCFFDEIGRGWNGTGKDKNILDVRGIQGEEIENHSFD